MKLTAAAFAAYLLGSIPFALLLVKCLAGVDVRTFGSGNVGATNASRVFGKGNAKSLLVFLSVYILDFAKGFVPTYVGWRYFSDSAAGAYGAAVLLGACSVLGHCTSPFLGFRGGKGVATTTGVFAWLQPWVLLIALAAFFVVRLSLGEVFLGSLAIGIILAAGTILRDTQTAFGERWPVTALALFIAVFLFYTHRSNIRNYMSKGTDERHG